MAKDPLPLPKQTGDHAIAAVKAGLNLIPAIGGALASLVGDYVPTSTERSVKRALELLRDQLSALEGRIDVEQVNKDEFSELFKSCYLVVIRSHREEKLSAAAALLANLLLRPGDPSKSPYEELDHFVRCLDALSIGAISALGAALRLAERQGRLQFKQLADNFPDFDASLVMSLVRELQSLNLLRVQEGGIRLPDYGEVLLEITPVGRRFAERFIEGRMS